MFIATIFCIIAVHCSLFRPHCATGYLEVADTVADANHLRRWTTILFIWVLIYINPFVATILFVGNHHCTVQWFRTSVSVYLSSKESLYHSTRTMYRTTLPFLFPGVMNILYIFQVLQAPTKSQVDFYFQQGSVDWSPIEKKYAMLEVFLEYFFDAEDRHSTFSLRVQQTRGCVLPGFFAFISIQLLTHIDTEEEWTLCWWILDQVSLDTGRGCLAPTHPGICSFVPSVARCRNLLRLHCFVQEGWVGGQATCTLGQGTWSKTLSFSLNSCQSCPVLIVKMCILNTCIYSVCSRWRPFLFRRQQYNTRSSPAA